MRGQWRRGLSQNLAREGASTTGGGQEASTCGGDRVGVPLGGRHCVRRWRQRGEGLRSAAPCQSRENNRERGRLGAATRQEEGRGSV
jgi:hypothetical protein